MKWTLLLACTLAVATSCEKSNVTPEEADTLTSASTVNPPAKVDIVGKWRLVEYWQDRGDGTGQWTPATDPDEITFTASGEVIFSGNSPFSSRGFTNYRIIDANKIELSGGNNREEFYFAKKGDTELIFNPQCRENCSRRYQKVG